MRSRVAAAKAGVNQRGAFLVDIEVFGDPGDEVVLIQVVPQRAGQRAHHPLGDGDLAAQRRAAGD